MKKGFRFLFLSLVACGGGDSDDDNIIPTTEVKIPGRAVLLYPENEKTCETGTSISEEFSDVDFSWKAALDADTYEVKVTNLQSNVVKRKKVTNATSTQILLSKADPYTWQVFSSNSTSSENTASDTWKFYLSAPGIVNYAPFPADLKYPAHGTTISRNTGGVITLTWGGSDPDEGNSLSYTLYLDTVDGKQVPSEGQTNLSQQFLEVSLEANTTYFWRIKTDDSTHSSFSQVHSFQTNDQVEDVDNSNSIALSTKTFNISQEIEGVTQSRPIIIQTPSEVDTSIDYPIVFAFHGRGGNNNSWVNQLKDFTNNGDFIGIYPQGFLKSWNLGTEDSKADDVAFVDLIVSELKKYRNLNFDKMYAIGTSNGSGMVNKLAIQTNHFQAIAPIVSQLMESTPLLETTQPISVFQINGAADSTIPIDGGAKLGHVFLDAIESAKTWASHFNCDSEPLTENIGEDTQYIFSNCNGEKEVRYLRIENGEHNIHWQDPQIYVKVWAFFKRF